MRNLWTQDELTNKEVISDMIHVIENGGLNPDGAKITVADALSTPNAPLIMKRTITEVVVEAIEPNLLGTRLLQEIGFDGYGSVMNFTTVGKLGMGDLDMAEGQEYPEFGVGLAASGYAQAVIGKVGLAVKITDEMIKYNQWDIIGMHLRQAGYSLARHKEKKIMDKISQLGVITFDNANPNGSEIGRTTGRNLAGAGNGSLTVDDMFDMYARTMERGFTPDVMLVHPLAWATFIKDPIMRELTINGNGSGWFNGMPGQNIFPNHGSAYMKLRKMNMPYPDTAGDRSLTQQSIFPKLPMMLPFGPITIIPTHYVPFNPVTKTTDIIMLDTRELGALVVAESPTTEEWNDPARDIKKIKIRERYGVTLFNNGQGISIARNLSIEPNAIALPPKAVINDIPPIIQKP